MNTKEIRGQARKRLKGNWLKFALLSIIIGAITISGQFIGTYTTIVSSIFGVILGIGLIKLYLDFNREGNFSIHSLVCSPKQYLKSIGYMILLGISMYIFIFIVALIVFSLIGFNMTSVISLSEGDYSEAIIGGLGNLAIVLLAIIVIFSIISIIIQLYLFAVPYLIIDGIGIFASIAKSVRIVKGHKFTLFKLMLSFIGWHILSILTVGIGYVFLIPYIRESYTIFYLELTNDYRLI